MEISCSNQCKDTSYSKEKGKQKKDTGCEYINSETPHTTCSFIKQQFKYYCGIAEIDPNSVQKFRISKAHEINANPEKDMSTQIPKKKPLQNGKKVIILSDSILWHQKPDILSKSPNKVNVKFYPGATEEDITDHLRPAMRKKPDTIIIQTGIND